MKADPMCLSTCIGLDFLAGDTGAVRMRYVHMMNLIYEMGGPIGSNEDAGATILEFTISKTRSSYLPEVNNPEDFIITGYSTLRVITMRQLCCQLKGKRSCLRRHQHQCIPRSINLSLAGSQTTLFRKMK